jgi:hypothetical protein
MRPQERMAPKSGETFTMCGQIMPAPTYVKLKSKYKLFLYIAQKSTKKKKRRRIERAAGGRIKGGGRQMVFSKAERNYMHTWVLTACTFL